MSNEKYEDRVRRYSFDSAALGRKAEYLVITPGDYRPGESLPVLYLLHGGDDVPDCWVDNTDLLALSAHDRLLIVLPEGGVVGYYSDWHGPQRDGVRPCWERFHLEEIPRRLAEDFGPAARSGIAGLSMGGYGAMIYAARSGTFAVAASFSGLPHILRRGIPAFLAFALRREHQSVRALWGSPRNDRANWVDHDPYHLAERLVGTSLYLSCGTGEKADGDEVFAGSGPLERICGASTWSFAERLDTLGIPYTASRHVGTHDWPYWRRELRRAWPFLTNALKIP